MDKTTLITISLLAMVALGYGIRSIQQWMNEELPSQREIKRRMKRKFPQAKKSI